MWCTPLFGLVLPLLAQSGDIAIEGRINVRDTTGQWIGDADGRFVLRVFLEEWTEREIEFTNGAFAIRLPRGSSCNDVIAFRSNLGTGHVNRIFTGRVADWNGRLQLNAVVAPPLVVNVLDPETNEPLECVDVGSRRYEFEWYRGRHGDSLEVESDWRDLASLFQETFVCYVRAPGRIETTVTSTPDSISGGTHTVYLERAGMLALSFRDPSPSTRHTFLEVMSIEKGFEHRGRIDPRGVPPFEGLRPGPYLVRVVHEFLDFKRVVQCERTVYVHPGVMTSERMLVTPLEDDTDEPWQPIEAR